MRYIVPSGKANVVGRSAPAWWNEGCATGSGTRGLVMGEEAKDRAHPRARADEGHGQK
jgi:hypothetical protein